MRRLRPLRPGEPFDFRRGAPPPGRYPPDGLGRTAAIEAVRPAPVEVGYGFDVRDRQVFRHVGDRDWIARLRPDDLRAIADGAFVHNHPPYAEFPAGDPRRRAGSFSPTDLVLMTEYDLAEMIVATAERTYIVRRLPEGFYLDPGEIVAAYRIALVEIEEQLHRQAATRLVAPELAQSRGFLADKAMERLQVFYDYWWEEVS